MLALQAAVMQSDRALSAFAGAMLFRICQTTSRQIHTECLVQRVFSGDRLCDGDAAFCERSNNLGAKFRQQFFGFRGQPNLHGVVVKRL